MRLISMSSHAKMQTKKKNFLNIAPRLKHYSLKSRNASFRTLANFLIQNNTAQKHLIIIIGSQKGLCGNFNNNLLNYFNTLADKNQFHYTTLVTIGKKASDLTKNLTGFQTMIVYEKFNTITLESLASTLIKGIITHEHPFNSVTIFSNKFKTFFTHQPVKTRNYPFYPCNRIAIAGDSNCPTRSIYLCATR